MGNSSAGRVFTIGSTECTIVRPLGEGGFADVFLVKSNQSKQYFALKRILVNRDDSDKVAIARWELMLNVQLRPLNHPNLVRCEATEQRRDSHQNWEFFLLLEYCPNGTLMDQLKAANNAPSALTKPGKMLSNAEVRDLLIPFADLLSGLAVLHSHEPPIMHRDVKPENLVRGDKEKDKNKEKRKIWKLLDFGSSSTSSIICASAADRVAAQSILDRTTTPSYRAPEMCDLYSGQPIGPAADLWAAGIVLYQLLFRSHPFSDGALGALSGKFRVPEHHGAPPPLIQLLNALLTVDQKKRATANEALTALGPIMGEQREVPAPWRSGLSSDAVKQEIIRESGRKSISGPVEANKQNNEAAEAKADLGPGRARSATVAPKASKIKEEKKKKHKEQKSVDETAKTEQTIQNRKEKSKTEDKTQRKKNEAKHDNEMDTSGSDGEAEAELDERAQAAFRDFDFQPAFPAIKPLPNSHPKEKPAEDTKEGEQIIEREPLHTTGAGEGTRAELPGERAAETETGATVAIVPSSTASMHVHHQLEGKAQTHSDCEGLLTVADMPPPLETSHAPTVAVIPQQTEVKTQPPPPPLPVHHSQPPSQSPSVDVTPLPTPAPDPVPAPSVPPPFSPAPPAVAASQPAAISGSISSSSSSVPALVYPSGLPSESSFHRSRVYSILEDFSVDCPRSVLDSRPDLLIASADALSSLFKKLLKKDPALFKLKYIRQFVCSSWASADSADSAAVYRGIPAFFELLSQRPIHHHSVTAFKSLLLLHRLMFQGSPAMLEQIFQNRNFFVSMDANWSGLSRAAAEQRASDPDEPVLDLLDPLIKYLVRRVLFLCQYRQFEGNFSLSFYLDRLFHHPLFPDHWLLPCSSICEQLKDLLSLLHTCIHFAALVIRTSSPGEFDPEAIKLRVYLLVPLMDDAYAIWLAASYLLTQLALYLNTTAQLSDHAAGDATASVLDRPGQNQNAAQTAANASVSAVSAAQSSASSASPPSSVSSDSQSLTVLPSLISSHQQLTDQLHSFLRAACSIPLVASYRRCPSLPRRINPFQPLQPLYFPPPSNIPSLQYHTLRLALTLQLHIHRIGQTKPISFIQVDQTLAEHEAQCRARMMANKSEPGNQQRSPIDEETRESPALSQPLDNVNADGGSASDPFSDESSSAPEKVSDAEAFRGADAEAEPEQEEEEKDEDQPLPPSVSAASPDPDDPFTVAEAEEKRLSASDPFSDAEETPFDEESKAAPRLSQSHETPFDQEDQTPKHANQASSAAVKPSFDYAAAYETPFDPDPLDSASANPFDSDSDAPEDANSPSDQPSSGSWAELASASSSPSLPVFPSYSDQFASDYTADSLLFSRPEFSLHRGLFRGLPVYIKRFTLSDPSLAPLQRRAFESESTFLTRFRHPNISLLLTAVERQNELELVTEALPSTLAALLHDRHSSSAAIPLSSRLCLALDVARALNFLHLHRPPVVYRLVSSEKILVDTRGNRAKLTDFAKAKLCKPGKTAEKERNRRQSTEDRTSQVAGSEAGARRRSVVTSAGSLTLPYLAPELLDESAVASSLPSIATDSYAFGILLWELLACQRPFHKHPNIVSDVISGARPPLEAVSPLEARELIAQLWAQDPNARLSIGEAALRLERMHAEAMLD